MHSDQDDAHITSKRKLEKSESHSDAEKKSDVEDPKPRIVLTFRSEKPGAKSSNMKIVSTEEKHDDSLPKRSSRSRAKLDSDDEALITPKKDKSGSRPVSENEEASDSSHTPLKRSMRRRSKEFSDNILANAIARKEKSYNETTSVPQRLSRRIKPTAKVLANKELRIGVETQNNARLGITDKSPEEGVRTRRSARRHSNDSHQYTEMPSEKKNTKRRYEDSQEEDEEEIAIGDSQKQNQVKKLKHLCELGLKAIDLEDESGENECEPENEDGEDEELDDETEVINQLIEADAESITEGSDEDFYCSAEASQSDRPRRSTRLSSAYGANESDDDSLIPGDDEQKALRRRSPRKATGKDACFTENERIPAGGQEGSEATCPEEESGVIGSCFCETPSNVYAAPEELTEPVFCQAIELVDGIRVGCSHSALRADGEEEGNGYEALVRAGPRAPYLLTCRLHRMQLAKHMCCPACGLFCTQGTFYQCSEGHLFHLECGLPYNDTKLRPGCPHCGMYSYRWQPVNRDCAKVMVEMKCSNKRVFLPDQRLQCKQAYSSFSTLDPAVIDPGIPEDLVPVSAADIKHLIEDDETTNCEELVSGEHLQRFYDAIVAGEPIKQLVQKIKSCVDVEEQVAQDGAKCAHAAARRGNLLALHLLHSVGANLDVTDAARRIPLMIAILALLDKSDKKDPDHENKDAAEQINVDQSKDEIEDKTDGSDSYPKVKAVDDIERGSDEDLMKIIRYLVTTGCNVNHAGPDDMTALHMAAQHGSMEVCTELLRQGGADVDTRDHGGWTPLVWAAESGHVEVVRLLIRYGADVMAMDTEGNSAAHWCALEGHDSVLRELVRAAPRAAYALNAHADTPLHVAARQGHIGCVVSLLGHGAKTEAVNSAGERAVDVCAGPCQSAIALNMYMASVASERGPRHRLLSTDISKGREKYQIPCVNDVDETPLPDAFTYVTQHVMPTNLPIDNSIQTIQGCSCSDETCSQDSCACCVLGVRRWYRHGRLLPSFPYHEPPMLFECNQTCACNLKQCTNYVVSRQASQGATFVRAEVFRTSGRGWGLRAAEAVPRGAPVALYCGELLALHDADARPADQYMFALAVKQDLVEQCEEKMQLCVDAAQYGSAARFVNHSCAPNLAPVRVFRATRDLRLPTVVLFATRNIAEGEEFTFDYGDKFWSVKSKWMKCLCGTPDCRYPANSTE